jgi:hypothetical protein
VVCRPRGPCVGPKPHPWVHPSIRRAARSKAHLAAARLVLPSASFRVTKDRPSIDMTGRCPLPAACGLPRPLPSARRCHAPCSFRPRGFSPPRRLPPPAARGLVASHCRPWGSSGFRLDARCAGARGGFPADAMPSRAFPTRTAVPASPRAVALVPLQVAIPGPPGPARLQGLAPYEQCVAGSAVAGWPPPVALLGFPSWSITSVVPSSHPWTTRRRAGGAVHARTLSGDRARRACVPSPWRCGLPVRAGPREAGELGLCTRGGTILPGLTGEPVGWGPRQGPEANPGGPQAGWQAHGRQRTTCSPPRPGCPGPERGAASLRHRPAEAGQRHHTLPDVVSGPSLVAPGNPRPGTLAGAGRGPGRREDPTGGGSEAIPTRPPPCGRGHTAAAARSPAGPPSSSTWACRPTRTCPSRTRLGPGRWSHRVSPLPPRPCQDSAGPGVAALHPACSFDPRVSSGGSTAVVCATSARPLRDEASTPPSRGKRRAPQPGCVLTDLDLHRRSFRCSRSPRRPVGPLATSPACSHTPWRRARVEPPICSMSSRAARPDGRTPGRAAHVWPSAPFVARGCSRARPGRSPCASRHPQATGDQEGHARPRPSPDVAASPRRDPQPATSRPPVQKPHLLPTPTEVVRPAHPGCPREAGREGRARTVSSPAEGARPLARGEAGWPGERVIGAARVAGFRSTCGRGSRERPSPARLACVAGRSCGSITPWAGAGRSEDRRDACSVAASTRGTLVVRASRDAGVRPVPRAEE